jgi:hypothetical protein
VKTPAKPRATPRKRKGSDNDEGEDNDNEDTPAKKSVNARKATPKTKKIKEEVEENCDDLLQEGVEVSDEF